MAFNSIFATILLIGIVRSPGFAQKIKSTPSTTILPEFDPYGTGNWGNHGARTKICEEALDAIHSYATKVMKNALQVLTIPEFSTPHDKGQLTIKSPHISDANITPAQYTLLPPNRVRTRFNEARLVAKGVWQYKPSMGNLANGVYQATINGAEVVATTQLGRSSDGRPMVQSVECKATVKRSQVQIQDSRYISTNNCDYEACKKIIQLLEVAICNAFVTFVKDIVNRDLQLYPTKINVNNDLQKVDYTLMNNEPSVIGDCIQFGAEGKYIWRGASAVPFYPSDMQWSNHGSMVSFQLSDYAFNTLLHQAHAQGFQFSANALLGQSPDVQQLLGSECTDDPTPEPTPQQERKQIRGGVRRPESKPKPKCLGRLLKALAPSRVRSDIGDVVYKTGQKAGRVLIDPEFTSTFDGSNGVLELVSGGQVMARMDVQLLRGVFTPTLNTSNVTGIIYVTDLQLAQSSRQRETMTTEWLAMVADFVTPILTDMFNAFLEKYAQFPVPLPSKYQCPSPEFTILPRSVQLDCYDVQKVRCVWGWYPPCDGW